MMTDPPSAPLYPRRHAPFRVHWNWYLLQQCNYGCSYCPEVEYKRTKTAPLPILNVSLDDWTRIWDRLFGLYGSALIRFAGGEPFIFPHFIDFLAMLTEHNAIDVTTNLSFDVDEFLRKVTPDALAISASYHPEHVSLGEFLGKLERLKREGFCVSAALVAYPTFLGSLKKTIEGFDRADIQLKLIPFRGKYQGRDYPLAYTQDEKDVMRLATQTRNTDGNVINAQWFREMVEKEEKRQEEIRAYNERRPDPSPPPAPVPESGNGKSAPPLCRMGENYAKIYADGTVRRCCCPGVPVMGRIMDKDFRLLDAAGPCDVPCLCWKPMKLGEYESRWETLWQGLVHRKHPLKTEGD
ncbi:MAG TPA: hypothetical protein P5079_00605 [Elusimicrobiota bacterium]|nr:hypothetical protein [Elusimicrobiota bacterium]